MVRRVGDPAGVVQGCGETSKLLTVLQWKSDRLAWKVLLFIFLYFLCCKINIGDTQCYISFRLYNTVIQQLCNAVLAASVVTTGPMWCYYNTMDWVPQAVPFIPWLTHSLTGSPCLPLPFTHFVPLAFPQLSICSQYLNVWFGFLFDRLFIHLFFTFFFF